MVLQVNHMIGGLKGVLSRTGAAVGATLVAAMSAVRTAFAAGTDSNVSPEYAEMLRLAEEKVNAATQAGATGNGVPIIGGDFIGMLPWLGAGLAVAIVPFFAAKFLVPRIKRESIIAQ
jgi:hypothetical protein